MATGTEMLVNALVKATGIDPQMMIAEGRAVRDTVLQIGAALHRIEVTQELILKHLGVSGDGGCGEGNGEREAVGNGERIPGGANAPGNAQR